MIKYLLPALLLAGCASTPKPQPEGMHWIDGCWQSEDGRFKEVWSTADGLSKGAGTVTKGDQVISSEVMVMQQSPNFYFEATPSGSKTTRFMGVSDDLSEAGWAVGFLNQDHDYPQLITYTRTIDQAGDRLVARIALADGTNDRAFEYRRCPKG